MKRYRVGLIQSFDKMHSDQVDGLRAALGGFGIGRISPHITLVPPSNIHPRDIDSEIYRLRVIASETEPFSVEAGPAATFHPVSPVVYLSVSGDGVSEMIALQEKVISSALYKQNPRPFVPHVTLMDPAGEDEITSALSLLKSHIFRQELNSFELMLSPSQGYWEVSTDFKFSPRRRVHRGGMPLEVFVHRSGDPSIYRFARERGISPSLYSPHTDRRMRSDGQLHLVVSIYHEGELVGSGSASYHSTMALVRAVAVRKDLERLGLGSLLVTELLYQLRLVGVEAAFAVSGDLVTEFYAKCGAESVEMPGWLVSYEAGMTLNSWSFSSL